MKKHLLSVAMVAVFGFSQAQNLLTDGGFDFDGALGARTAEEWGMWSDNGGIADVIDGVCTVTPVEATDNWKMQVEQWNSALENDVTYIVTFDAWADADRVITLTIEDPANGYALLGQTDDEGAEINTDGDGRSKWNIDITTDQTSYTRTITVDAIQDNTNVKFAFLLAQTSDKVYIDNVSIVEEGVSVKSKVASEISVYPNPTSKEVYVNVEAGKVLNIYNVAGGLLSSQVITQANQKIDVSQYEAGLYILKVGQTVSRLIIK